MPRAKKSRTTVKRRRNILRQTKGYRWGRKSKLRQAREALIKAYTYSYRDRRVRKRDKRALWQTKINAAARQNGTTYSRLISALKKNNVGLNRKMLSELAEHQPEIFKSVVESVIDASSSSKNADEKVSS